MPNVQSKNYERLLLTKRMCKYTWIQRKERKTKVLYRLLDPKPNHKAKNTKKINIPYRTNTKTNQSEELQTPDMTPPKYKID